MKEGEERGKCRNWREKGGGRGGGEVIWCSLMCQVGWKSWISQKYYLRRPSSEREKHMVGLLLPTTFPIHIFNEKEKMSRNYSSIA